MPKINLTCIIDDDPIFVFAGKRIMKAEDFCTNFIEFTNGNEAMIGLSKLITSNEEMPEVILLDLNIPIMDGWGFLEEFTQIDTPSKINIYILTSSVDPMDIKRAKSYSDKLSNFLVKPISRLNLVKILEDFS